MKAMAQKRMSDLFNTKRKKQAKIIKYCISTLHEKTPYLDPFYALLK